MNSLVDFAILASVPEEHLDDGLPMCAETGFVAYGSQKWELFRKVDEMRGGESVPALIYPSDQDSPDGPHYVIQWTGWYIDHVDSIDGTHPDGATRRPQSTFKYRDDNTGFWAVLWHVAELQNLPEREWQAIASVRSYATGEFWQEGHPPRGPEVVARPKWI